MKKLFLFVIVILLMTTRLYSQAIDKDEKMKWWREARFGMFIHWGVYAVPAGMYKGHKVNRIGEWIMNRGKIPVAEYKTFARQFNPVKYDPDAWVKMAKDAGMKYIVITSKHHDGFALFDSKVTTWDIVDATPYGKDVIKPLAEACRRHGIKLGLYYSHAQDWVNPGGAAARKKTTEGWANPDSTMIDAYTEAHSGHWDPAQTTRTMEEYINDIAVPQVKEILTKYGDIAVLWWDTPTGMTTEFAEKFQALLPLQPRMITNDRLKRPDFPGDFKTPEQRIPDLSELDGKDWETCMTMNGTWGYKSYDDKWKTTETLIRNLLDIASKGGNYLLNVGPKADGEFPTESIDRLKAIGTWMKTNGEAIYGTQASPLASLPWGRCTRKEQNGNTTLYLSVFDWPKDGKLIVPALPNEIYSAHLLAGGKKVEARKESDQWIIALPPTTPDPIATVIKVEVKGIIKR
ncbi:MAG TPA: alpha-L-fucosidase [Ohtaekwangia sp.]|uniref:alpha-L-fucosidase n=1 Tax=Ohtaekwangia sp. TaxID=2066019 RepID=UPI002F92DA2D